MLTVQSLQKIHPVVSFVIPTYNRNGQLSRCVESIIRGNSLPIEIIIIDDCSSSVIGGFDHNNSKSNIKFKYYRNKKNEGVSYCRNLGIENAEGEWICFVDSDDVVMIDELLQLIDRPDISEADIIIANYRINGELVSIEKYNTPTGNKINIEDLVLAYLNNPVGNSILTYVWAKLFRRKFVNKYCLQFDEEMCVYEDSAFIANAFNYKPAVLRIDKDIYNYTIEIDKPKVGIVQPLGFDKVIHYHVQTIKNRSDIACIRKIAEDSFVAKTLMLELNKNEIYFRELLLKFEKQIRSIKARNVKNRIIRWLCVIGINKNIFVFKWTILIIWRINFLINRILILIR